MSLRVADGGVAKKKSVREGWCSRSILGSEIVRPWKVAGEE
jgi:hypothetical protein